MSRQYHVDQIEMKHLWKPHKEFGLLCCVYFLCSTKDSIDFKERTDGCLEVLACLADVMLGIEVSGACGGNELEDDDNDEVIVYGDEEELEVTCSSENGSCFGGCASCGMFAVLDDEFFDFMLVFKYFFL